VRWVVVAVFLGACGSLPIAHPTTELCDSAEGSVQGVVEDERGQPLGGVVVSTEDRSARTNPDGWYRLCLPPGDHEVQLTRHHSVATWDTHVAAGKITPIDQRFETPPCDDQDPRHTPATHYCFP
jgi:hypothetical protein